MSCKRIDINHLTIDLLGSAPRRLVENLTLSVDAGRALALVGESGAGKSMTALAVMGLLPAGIRQSGGEILINERTLAGMDAEASRRVRNRDVAMIMQNPMSAFDPVFTIDSHFRETIRSHYTDMTGGEMRAGALQALREVGFADPAAILDIYPFQMSGGMLQRVMIALALVTNPTFLIADEATTDLDVVSQKQILAILRERCRERHLGLLVITHDLGVAAWLADDIAVMRHGGLVEKGVLREVFARPEKQYTRELLAAHRELHGDRFGALARRVKAGVR